MGFPSFALKHALIVFVMSMVPIVELRGAIPYAAGIGLPMWESILIAILGNMIVTPFIILFVRKIFNWCKGVPVLCKIATWCENHVLSKKEVLEKYELIGLIILVAIPLPGTGAWTGAMLAGLLGMRMKKAIPAVFVGVIIAAIVVACVSYGFVGAIDFLMLNN